MTELTRDKLNQLRRYAGVPQDFTAERRQTTVTEDIFPGMSQILRGGKHKFYLVTEADKNSDLGDVLAEVDFRALTNIIRGAGDKGTKEWELFPHNKQNDALNLARERLAGVTEQTGDGMQANNPNSVPHPNDEEIRTSLEQEEDFEPATNICPDCEGGEHPPAVGKCERCGGEGEIFEGKKQKPDFADIDKDGDKKESAKKAAKEANEEQEEVKPDFADIDKDGDKKEPAKKAAEEAKEEQEEVAKKDYDKDGKIESSEEEHKGVVDKAIKKSKGKKVKESMGYHTDDNYPLTHVDSEQPHNVDASYETIWDKPEENEEDYQTNNDDQKIKVPSKILSELKRVISEVTKESEKAKPRDMERANYYEDTAEALQIVHDELSKKTVQGLKQAQYLSQRMMNIQRALMPDATWKFLVDGGTKRSLKSYMNAVKEPVTGKPFDVVDIETLNKNTHTQ